jgi:hypothetical protein
VVGWAFLFMSTIELPAILDIPNKLKPIITEFNNYNYFLIEGGRSSAKSHSVARFISYLADFVPSLRVFCGREIQNTIEESVYQLFKDLILDNNLAFNVGAKKIDHKRNGSMIRFRGFREQGKVNIKGLEGVDIVWVDEAQSLTKKVLDMIIPTIRKKGSKIFFTLNRTLKDDPVYMEMAGRKDCLHIHIDYFENKHCPVKAMAEAEQCRQRNIDDYNHIWLGKPRDQANNAVFRNVSAIVEDYPMPIPAQTGFDYLLGIDLARSIDYTVFIVFCVQLRRIVYFERLENENKTSWNYQEEKAHQIAHMYNNALLVPDSTGVGDPLVERWQRRGLRVFHNQTTGGLETPGVKFNSINKENLIEKLKIAIELQLITIPKIKVLVDELVAYESVILPSRNYRYSAPQGKHDDCVIALALAVWGVRSDIYEQWKPKIDEKIGPIWQRVKQDIQNKNNQESDTLEAGNDPIIIHDEETDDQFADPFGDD